MARHVKKHSNTKNQKKSIHLSSLKTTHAGIDIGATSIYVCIATSEIKQIVKSFTTYTPDGAVTSWKIIALLFLFSISYIDISSLL